MRQYEPAWIELKTCSHIPKQIRISAPAKFHPRIYKAVIKEKDMDVVHKLALDDLGKKGKLSKKSVANLLIITLHILNNHSIGLADF